MSVQWTTEIHFSHISKNNFWVKIYTEKKKENCVIMRHGAGRMVATMHVVHPGIAS